MLAEHEAEASDVTPWCTEAGATHSRSGAAWARPKRARRGRLWRVARRLLERALDPAPDGDRSR